MEAANKKLEISAQNLKERTEWSTVVKRNSRRNDHHRGQSLQTTSTHRERADNPPGASAARRSRTTENEQLQNNTNRERVVVPGVRRVWGTFKLTPAGAVVATLKKLTTIGDRLSVKRVFRKGIANGRDRWWFHLLGEEDLLKQLEGEWESVSLQTNWKLETCTKPAAANDTSTGHFSPLASSE